MMKRRLFVKLGLFSAGALTIPFLQCKPSGSVNSVLYRPAFLSQICEEKELLEIGLDYRKLNKEGNKPQNLVRQLLTNKNGKTLSEKTPSEELTKMIQDKIHQNFADNDFVTIKGWVISETEAQQCALYTHQKQS